MDIHCSSLPWHSRVSWYDVCFRCAVYMCICMYLWACMWRCACTCMNKMAKKVNLECLHQSTLLRQGLSLTLVLTNSAKLAGQLVPGTLPSRSTPPLLNPRHATTAPGFSHGCWESKFTSCLCNQHFAKWVVFAAPLKFLRCTNLFKHQSLSND